MVRRTHTINLCRPNKISQIVRTIFLHNKNKLTCFYVIATKPVDIGFKKNTDKIREVNENYVTL